MVLKAVNPEIGNAVLQAALTRAQVMFGDRLVAAYALGSLAHGGFSSHVSDVDLGLVLADPLGAADAEAVASLNAGVRVTGLPLADLVQEGTIGLIQAVRRFRPERGVRLSTYAMWSIRAAIQDYVVRSWSAVRVGTTAKQKSLFFSLSRVLSGEAAVLETRLTDFARRSGHRMADILTVARRLAARDQSLDAPLRSDNGQAATDAVSLLADQRPDAEMQLAEASERRLIAAVIAESCANLAPRELHIIRKRYLTQASATLEAVAHELDLSKERVRQLEKQALAKLREAMMPKLRQGLVGI